MKEAKSHRPARHGMKTGACAFVLLMGMSGAATAQDIAEALAEAAGVPQMDAFLPDKYSVSETQALPIDGVWTISSIRKKIRIERGRAYAVDPWLHMFTLKVRPDMVVLQNFERTSAGVYTADDLPLLGPATMQLKPDGNLSVRVKGALGPVAYTLIKREADDKRALDAEIYAMVHGGALPADAPRSDDGALPPYEPPTGQDEQPGGDAASIAECETLGVDPVTDVVICLD